jgi:hypothetical protein
VYRNHQKARRESGAIADIDFDGMSNEIAEDEDKDKDKDKDENAK